MNPYLQAWMKQKKKKQALDEFLQWMKDNGRAEYKENDVYVRNGDQVEVKKAWGWSVKHTPEDWEEFCKATGKNDLGSFTFVVDQEIINTCEECGITFKSSHQDNHICYDCFQKLIQYLDDVLGDV